MKLKRLQMHAGYRRKGWLLSVIFCNVMAPVFSQFSLKFRVKDIPAGHAGDSIFVAGSFNNWAPGKNGIPIKSKDTNLIELSGLNAGNYEFKLTRGEWTSVECKRDGYDLGNREIKLSSDTTIDVSIAGWKDDFPTAVKQHTVSPNVQILDTAFKMPQLGRTRRIWIYLPPGYKKGRKRYPVMYLQDGQNVFDSYTASFGEWGVDECADTMIRDGKPACIIIGIDNGPKRLTEYNPYDFKDAGKGEGDRYVDFIAQTLKPFIDKRFRTQRGPRSTIIAGSSMGGLIAYYAMLKYPAIFGKGGIFSPAFWTADQIKVLTDSSGSKLDGKLFFYLGDKEGERAAKDLKEVTDKLGEKSTALIYTVTDPEGEHNEAAWRKWFPEFYKWVLASGFNNVIKLEEVN